MSFFVIFVISLVSLIVIIGLFVILGRRHEKKLIEVANEVAEHFLQGKRLGLTIDQIEIQLADKYEIVITGPWSRQLERNSFLFTYSAAQETKEFLVLQRIGFDICCVRGLFPRATGNVLTQAEHRNLTFIGEEITKRLQNQM